MPIICVDFFLQQSLMVQFQIFPIECWAEALVACIYVDTCNCIIVKTSEVTTSLPRYLFNFWACTDLFSQTFFLWYSCINWYDHVVSGTITVADISHLWKFPPSQRIEVAFGNTFLSSASLFLLRPSELLDDLVGYRNVVFLSPLVENPFSKCPGRACEKNYVILYICIFDLAIVTSQALKYGVIYFVSMFKQSCAMFYKPSMTPIYATSTCAHKCN